MTTEQYKKYNEISEQIEPIKDFLCWCGKRYKGKGLSKCFMRILKRKRGVSIGRKGWGGIESTEIPIPVELQEIIIEDIEKWVDQKEKELSEI